MAVVATHALNVYRWRALSWGEQAARTSKGKQCFIEEHGLAIFYGGSLALHLALSLPIVLLTVAGANVWDVVSPRNELLPALLMGLLTGLCRSPADHALLLAQSAAGGSPLSLRWALLSGAREAAHWGVFVAARSALPHDAGTASVLTAAWPSLVAVCAAVVAVGPLDVLRCRMALASSRPSVVAVEQLLMPPDSNDEQDEAGGEDRGGGRRRRGGAGYWLAGALPARLLHAVLLFLVTSGWAHFLATR